MLRPIARLLSVVAVLVLVFALVAEARPRIRREFVAAYPKTQGTRLDACVTCHTPAGGTLNPYGAAVQKAVMNFQAIEKLDSDGDGISNRAEIDSLSFPGDSLDRPGAHRDSTGADSTRRDRPQPGSVRPDTSGARPDTLRPPGGAKPDTLGRPKQG